MIDQLPGGDGADRSAITAGRMVPALSETVIQGGYCIGCGACAALPESPYSIYKDRYGKLQARLNPGCDDRPEASAICPFGAAAVDETEISDELYSGEAEDTRIGRFRAIWAGHVAEGDFRVNGSSGGMGNWLATELLRSEEVDAVLHVQPRSDGRLFGFAVSKTANEVMQGSKSRYYPVEMSGVLTFIRENPGRYALVGVPCMVKAARLQARFDSAIAERLAFTIALVCGHMKSERFAEMIAWQMGVNPGTITGIDFRVKNDSGRADHYSIEVQGQDGQGQTVVRRAKNKDLFGHLWGHGFFKYRACDYCDDVFGETADVTVGDAWLPGLREDPRGSNVVVVRSQSLDAIVRNAISTGRLNLMPLSPDEAAQSQDAGLRHRRRGLAVRLGDAAKRGCWIPPKRVAPYSDGLSRRRRWVYRIRERMSEHSHVAFAEARRRGDFDYFRRAMSPWMSLHDWVNSRERAKGFVKRMLKLLRGR